MCRRLGGADGYVYLGIYLIYDAESHADSLSRRIFGHSNKESLNLDSIIDQFLQPGIVDVNTLKCWNICSYTVDDRNGSVIASDSA